MARHYRRCAPLLRGSYQNGPTSLCLNAFQAWGASRSLRFHLGPALKNCGRCRAAHGFRLDIGCFRGDERLLAAKAAPMKRTRTT